MQDEKDHIQEDGQQDPSTEAPENPADAAGESHGNDDADRGQEGVDELKDKYLRLFAEFDNYKKRVVRERLDLMRTASQDMMAAILPVLDDFDRARRNADEKGRSEDPILEGLLLVHEKLYGILRQKGLEPMESTGKPFDPEFHEAITEIPMPDRKGEVIDTVEKGYILNDKIIRYAKVVVGA
jgi:molecular chaperone GrpE